MGCPTMATAVGRTFDRWSIPRPEGNDATPNYGFIKAVVAREKVYGHDRRVMKTAMGETSGPTGGYIVPQEYSDLLLFALTEKSFFRNRSRIVPMTSGETLVPKLRAEAAHGAGVSPFFGGITYSWVSAAGGTSLPQSEPTFGQLSLWANDLMGELIASNQFVNDLSPEGERRLIELFGRAAAWYEEYAFFNGLGTDASQPIGILNANATISVSRAGGGSVELIDLSNMVASLLPFSWANSVWGCSPTALTRVCSVQGFVPNADVDSVENTGVVGLLMGRPVYATENLPALGSRGDVVLFDPTLYVIGDRMETIVEASPHPLFTTNQTVFRVWRRVDGKPLLSAPVTLQDATTQVSGFVALAA